MSDITRIPSRGLQRNLIVDLSPGSASEPSLRINHLSNETNYDHAVNTGLYSAGVDAIGFTLGGLPSLILKKVGTKTKAIFQNAATNPDNTLSTNEELGVTVFGDVGIHGDLYTKGKIRADNLILSSNGYNNYPVISKENLTSLKQDVPVEDGQLVFLVGENNSEDGRGGFYIWRASSTKTEDLNGLTVIANNNTAVGRYELVSFGRFNPFTIYVAPDNPAATDSKTNDGNNPERPFKTIARACAEVARRFCDTRYNLIGTERFTIVTETGNYTEDNRLGLNSHTAVTVSSPLWHLNSPRGGIIIPRGTSIMGRDLRKVIIRPVYVPSPSDNTQGRTSIFRMTGGVFFMNFTFRDKVGFNQSHHKLSCFEFATNSELSTYYQKICNWFDIPASFRSPVVNQFETNIVTGNLDFQFNQTLNVQSADNTVDSASPYIFSCSLRSVYGMCGIHGDGGDPNSPDRIGGLKSYLAAQFTVVSLQKDPNAFVYGVPVNMGEVIEKRFKGTWADDTSDWRHFGYAVSNNAYSQLVSCFCIGPAIHYWARSGGEFSITNSTSNFGDVSLQAEGYRTDRPFIQDTCYKAIAVIPPKNLDNNLQYISLGDVNASTFINHSTTTGENRQFRFKLANLNEIRLFYDNSYSIQNDSSDVTRRRIYFVMEIPAFSVFDIEDDTNTNPSLTDLANNSEIQYIGGFRFGNNSGTIVNTNSNGIRVELSALVTSPFNSANKLDINTLTLSTDIVISNLKVHAYWDSNGNYITSGGIVGSVIHELNNFNPSSNPSRYSEFLTAFRNLLTSSPIQAKRYIDNRSNYEKLYKLRISYPENINYGGFQLRKKAPEVHYVFGAISNFGNTSDDVTIDNPTYLLGQTNYNSNSTIFVIEEICKEGILSSEPVIPLHYRQLKNVVGFLGSSSSTLLINSTPNQGQFNRYVDVIIANANRSKNNAVYKKYPFYNKEVIVDSIVKNDINTEIYNNIDVTKDENGNRTENFLTMQEFLNVLNSISPISNLNMNNKNNAFATTNDAYVLEQTTENITSLPSRLGTNGYDLVFRRPSTIRCGGQTWEYMGNYNYNTSIPQGQVDYPGIAAHFTDIGANQLLSRRLKEISKIFTNYLGGNVYTTGMDDRGRFFIGQRIIDTKTDKEEDLRISLSIRFGNTQRVSEVRSREFDNLRVNNTLRVSNTLTVTPNNLIVSKNSIFNNSDVILNSSNLKINANSLIELNSSKFTNPSPSEQSLFEANENRWGLARRATLADINQVITNSSVNINKYVSPRELEYWYSRKKSQESSVNLNSFKDVVYVDSNFYYGNDRGFSAYWATQTGLTNAGFGTVNNWSQFVNNRPTGSNYARIISFNEFLTNFNSITDKKYVLNDRNSPNFVVFRNIADAIQYGNFFYGSSDVINIRLAPGIYPITSTLTVNFSLVLDGCNPATIQNHPFWLMSPIVNNPAYNPRTAQGSDRLSDVPESILSNITSTSDSNFYYFMRTYECSPVFKPENINATSFNSISSSYNVDFEPKHTSIIAPAFNGLMMNSAGGTLLRLNKSSGNIIRRVVFLGVGETVRIRNKNLTNILIYSSAVSIIKNYDGNTAINRPNFVPTNSGWNVNTYKLIRDLHAGEDIYTLSSAHHETLYRVIDCVSTQLILNGVVFDSPSGLLYVSGGNDRSNINTGWLRQMTKNNITGIGSYIVGLFSSSRLYVAGIVLRGNELYTDVVSSNVREAYSFANHFVYSYNGQNELNFGLIGFISSIYLCNKFGSTSYINTVQNFSYVSSPPVNDIEYRGYVNILPPSLSVTKPTLRYHSASHTNNSVFCGPVFYSFIAASKISELIVFANDLRFTGNTITESSHNASSVFAGAFGSLTSNTVNEPTITFLTLIENNLNGIRVFGLLQSISLQITNISSLNNYYINNNCYRFSTFALESGFFPINGSTFSTITSSSNVEYDYSTSDTVFIKNYSYSFGQRQGKTVLGMLLSLNIEPHCYMAGIFYGNFGTRVNQTFANNHVAGTPFTPIGSGAVLQVTTQLSKTINNFYLEIPTPRICDSNFAL